ncbi:MAG: CotH kinase family protein [Verrucomicrobiota bacterium]|nr:CotH kinase family protein [Verrucomicrobiota bacterium]
MHLRKFKTQDIFSSLKTCKACALGTLIASLFMPLATIEAANKDIQEPAPFEKSEMLDLSAITSKPSQLYKVLKAAMEMAKAGASHEAARIIATIAIKAKDSDVRYRAEVTLEKWNLNPEEVFRGNRRIVEQKVNASYHAETKPGDTYGHVRNLIMLNLLDEAMRILQQDTRKMDTRALEQKWGALFDQFYIPIQPLLDHDEGNLRKALQKAHQELRLKRQLPRLWFLDRSLWLQASTLMERQMNEKAIQTPVHYGRRETGYILMGSIAVLGLVACLFLILTGLGDSRKKKIGLACSITILIAFSSGLAYLWLTEPVIDESPYARWVVPHKKDVSTFEEKHPLQPAVIAKQLLQHTQGLVDSGQHQSARLILEILITYASDNAIQNQATKILDLLPPAHDIQESEIASIEHKRNSKVIQLFSFPTVHSCELEISPDAIKALHDNSKQYVEGTFLHQGKMYPRVGVRLKGGWGSFRMIDGTSKPGYVIKFDYFDKQQRFQGLKRIILNNSIQDETYMREAIAYSTFRDAGIPAPRVTHASLKVNGELYGLYVLLEAATKNYLERWFEDAGGNLYEGPGDIHNWQDLDLDSNESKNDRRDIQHLNQVIESANDTDPWGELQSLIDLKVFATFVALEQFLFHWDGYTITNNYRVYSDPSSGMFNYLPHGADQTFEDMMQNPFEYQQEGILGRALLLTATGRRQYREAISEILSNVWHTERMLERLAAHYKVVHPYALNAPGKTTNTIKNFEQSVTQMIQFISLRGFIVQYLLNKDIHQSQWRDSEYEWEFLWPNW